MTGPARVAAYPRRPVAPCLFFIVLAVLSGCAGVGGPATPPPIEQLRGAAAARLATLPPLPGERELLQLTPAMYRFLEENVANSTRDRERLMSLERSVHHPALLGIRYDPAATLSVADTFREQRGNCLSLSMLFVAMAREIGIDARFQEVEVEPYWDHRDGVVFATRHVNVVGRLNRHRYELDFYRPIRGEGTRVLRALSDREALAHFHNNRGAEALTAGDIADGYRWLTRAVELAPEISFIWSNLGALYQRNRQYDSAEASLRYAVALNRGNTSALNNLTRLLNDTGRFDEAEVLARRVDRLQRGNPYYYFAKAGRALDSGEPGAALAAIRRAIRLKPEEPAFYDLAAMAAVAADRPDLGERYRSERPEPLPGT
ncbi:MAG: tetratricopeptide repeat protein [Pseudomonadota bacterium]